MRYTLLALLVLSGCEAFPRVANDGDVPGSVLSGTLLAVDVDEGATTVVLMSAADNPQPPLGNGSPVSFAAIPGDQYGPAGAATLGAPFALTDVPPGDWQLNGLMDVDGNFHPGLDVLATPSCGDLSGWHLDRVDGGAPTAVSLSANDYIHDLVVGPLTRIDSPDPAFTIIGPRAVGSGLTLRLDAVDVSATFADLTLDVPGPDSADPCHAGFRFRRRDADGNGSADTSPLLPLFEDRWPRVLFRWLGTPVDTEDGTDFDRGDVPDDVTIAAIGDPSPSATTLPAPGVAIDVPSLQVAWTGFGQRIEANGDSAILAGTDLPAGAWSITVITEAGQIWTMPNEAGAGLALVKRLPSPGRTSDGDARQGQWAELAP